MYHQYFGLSEAPFSIAVNPRYLYMSPRHRDALAHLLYGVGAGGGFILLTGEVGTGKTTINRCLLEQLPDSADIAIVLNPALDARDLLASVCEELAIDVGEDRPGLKVLTDALHRFLLSNHAAGRKTVMMIDEAQHLSFEVLEQIRLLTNLETNEEKLLHIILIGQPELTAKLARPELRQLNQRITARFELAPLTSAETAAYVRHRLHIAGLPAGRELFTPSLLRAVYRESGGVPRLINLLCDRLLLGAYGQNLGTLNSKLLRQAAKEVLGTSAGSSWANRWNRLLLPAGAVVLVAAGLGALLASGVGERSGAPGVALPPAPTSQPTSQPMSQPVPQPVPKPESPPAALDAAKSAGAAANGLQADAGMPALATQAERVASLNSTDPAAARSLAAPDDPSATWRLSTEAGAARLRALYGVPAPESSLPGLGRDPCAGELPAQLRCDRQNLRSWNQLLASGRPALLGLIDSRRFESTAIFLGAEEEWALLAAPTGLARVSLQAIAEEWTGEVWQMSALPQGVVRSLQRGDRGADVATVARLFATLDGQDVPLAQSDFTPALEQRVRLFQRAESLEDDGVLGEQTLRALALAAGVDLSITRARELVAGALQPGTDAVRNP